ncbi:MAG TPA: polysaccharide deacetylase family protein [Pyrinomonadaceae bacterium]|jgi:peptidoglycan/xylan/chitin deacetylase (PgdA/CDA1 family)
MSAFRLVIFTSLPPAKVRHFLWRLGVDLPDVEVAGVLYETERPRAPLGKRLRRAGRYARDPDFVRFAAHKAAARAARPAAGALARLLHAAHGTARSPHPAPPSLAELARRCEGAGTAFHVTGDINGAEALEFVKSLGADLGVVYGTRILKPHLFEAPRLGSVNIHKHKVPDYRGSGAPGLWEMRDGRAEQTVTVHRVTKEVDAGSVLGERTFPIEPLDTLASVGLKADLLGVDCLVEVIGAAARGGWTETPQPRGGALFKGYQPHQIWAVERGIRRSRGDYRPRTGRTFFKLAARSLFYPGLWLKNRRRAREKSYPVVILFHHVITDRGCFLGMPTDCFLRQVRFLKRHYRIVSLPDALSMLERGEVDAPTAVLTFDDGYADNFLGLRAVAEAEDIPVTLFVCTRHVAERSEFQHDVDRGERGFRALGWDELRYLDRHNVTIGSHTRTHFDCGDDADEARLRDEIAGSLEDLRRELGHDVPYFAFPKGYPENMSAAARRIAAETYPYVFAAFGGVNFAPPAPGEVVRRSGLPESLLELELGLQSVLDFDTQGY